MRRTTRVVIVFGLALVALSATDPGFAQQAGTSCRDVNRTIFPWYLGRADNHVFICDGSVFQTLLTAQESPMQIGLGTTTPGAGLDVQLPETAASGLAYGARYQQTLTAAANGDALTALTINPTFVNGSYSGVANNGLIVTNGNVGIGTPSPSNPLTISYSNNAYIRALAVQNTNTGISALTGVSLEDSSGSIRANLDYIPTTYGNASIQDTAAFTTLGTTTKLAFITGADQSPLGGNDIYFQSGATNPNIYLKGSTGNVGIGTTSPGLALDVVGSQGLPPTSNITTTIGSIRADGTTNSVVDIGNNGSSPYQGWIQVENKIHANVDYSLLLNPNGGNVGIGTTSPAAQLDVYNAAGIGAINLGGVNGISYPSTDTTPGGSIAIGAGALAHQPPSNGYANTAVGYQVMNSASMGTGDYGNTGVGFQALSGLHGGGTFNTAVGLLALSSIQNGSGNVALGAGALNTDSTGGDNVGIGQNALNKNQNGTGNIGIGIVALYNNVNGNNNVAVGEGAAYVLTSGQSNTILGPGVASTTLTTGSNNILIGTNSGVDAGTSGASNTLNIGNLIYGTGLGTSGTTPAGSVGIGTTSPQATLDVKGYLRLATNSSQPAACSSTNDGALALTHVYTLCICAGGSSSWVQSKDGSTACSW